jgi:phage N-6-adenine-methyltransferase
MLRQKGQNSMDDWKTPQSLYDQLNSEFEFDFDPCPLHHVLEEWDGLDRDWGQRNFINPPYSRALKEKFILKAIEESRKGKLCVMLLPVSTSSAIFHDHILPNKREIRFLRGRVKFEGGGYKWKAMHDSMIVIFKGEQEERCGKNS